MDLRRFESEPPPCEYRGFCARNRVFNRHAAGVGPTVGSRGWRCGLCRRRTNNRRCRRFRHILSQHS